MRSLKREARSAASARPASSWPRTHCSPRTPNPARARSARASRATSAAAPVTSASSSRSGTPRRSGPRVNPAELALYPFERPATLAELCHTLSARAGRRERTVLLAGGTDWIVERGFAPPENPDDLPLVLDISRLPELRGIQLAKERAAIGAAATFLEIRSHPVLLRRVPVLTAMAREVGAGAGEDELHPDDHLVLGPSRRAVAREKLGQRHPPLAVNCL